MSRNYIPVRDVDFLAWAENLVKHIKLNARMLKLSAKEISEYQSLVARFRTDFSRILDKEYTNQDKTRKKESRKMLEKRSRSIVMGNIKYNPAVTDEFCALIEINPRRPSSKKKAAAETSPVIEVIPAFRKMCVRSRNVINGRRSRPEGIRCINYRWAVLDMPPESVESLSKIASKTSGMLTLEFEESQRGKAFYISACWETATGEKGPWCEIIKRYIS